MSFLLRIASLAALGLSVAALQPAALAAQKKPPAPPRDTLSTEARAELRRIQQQAREIARERDRKDTTARRALARAAEPTAFADPGAKVLLDRARVAREQQDSALRSYSAVATQRMSVGLGVRNTGLEKLLWRGDNIARIDWKRGVGVWVTPVGSRMVVPLADKVAGDGFTSAISVPYYPGRDALWPSELVKTDIDEHDLVHPIARGAEAYYRYATGDSLTIKLPDGSAVRIRELRITARKANWQLFVGSFWFDESSGQLVRAAYRLSMDIDIWSVADQSVVEERLASARVEQVRDSIARTTLDHDTYAKDSTRRAVAARKGDNDDEAPAWVKATFRPARAKVEGITVEYGLYQGRFWLPKANSATGSAQMGFVRVPVSIDEKFTYESVDGDLALPALPITAAASARRDSSGRGTNRDSVPPVVLADDAEMSGTVCVGGCKDVPPAKRDSLERKALQDARSRRDGALVKAKTSADSARIVARFNARRDVQCQSDSTWVRTETRYDGALRMAYRMPCDLEKLANAKELPAAYASDEKVFDMSTRDELLSTLDLSLQPEWAPQWPKVRSGVDLVRYNRVEGLSVGVEATQTLGAGYSLRALGRIGHADLHANGELTLERSNGRRTAFAGVFHRLAAVNPEWGGALTLGPSLPAFLYARDEGFYYRTFGAELGERREGRHGALDWRLFVERQYTAGDSDVVNTFSLGRAFGDRHFGPNIQSELSSFTGLAANWQQAYGTNPRSFRLTTALHGEMATGTREYLRGSLEATVTRPLGHWLGSVAASSGYSAGTVPVQRLWYMGGLKSVRGQLPGTQEGDAFWLLRSEIGRRNGFVRPVGFFDVGWAGARNKYGASGTQRGAGVGISVLDGLFRLDVSRGLFPLKRWRTDLYLGAPI